MKKYTQAPLPFQGQKRRFLTHFKEALHRYSNNATYVDLFGGSGLLSHTVKSIKPNAKVVYNDFDNYMKRINAIPSTNKILDKLRSILSDFPRGKRITGTYRSSIIQVLEEANAKGFVDWITISSSLKFSMNYSENLQGFINDALYNNVRKSNYTAQGYLSGVEVVREDYKVLFEKYKNIDNVVFLVDPPYLSTDSSTYTSDSYWKLQDYLEVLQVLKNSNYFYFTSNKSQIVELCRWISSVSAVANPFQNAHCIKVQTTTSYNSRYTDIMYHIKKR